jgi:ectoine hydroxylase-related dioxygenase (phytanoyl-CoA dioxygenase family)
MKKSLALTHAERQQYECHGYVLREGVLDEPELTELRDACEALCERLVAHSREARKVDVSQFYVFETDEPLNVMIKWEPHDRRVIQGVEPLAHLDPTLERFGMHPALTEPARELLEVDEVALYTEKLNVKRRGVGGPYALHRDLPYWLPDADDAHHMITALLTLDDATAENGALEVLPGSHLIEDPPFKESDLEFERNELDPDRMDTSAMVPIEMAAGSAVFFGPMLIHRSSANQSSTDRRALLYTYQRAGQRDQRDVNREWFETYGSL